MIKFQCLVLFLIFIITSAATTSSLLLSHVYADGDNVVLSMPPSWSCPPLGAKMPKPNANGDILAIHTVDKKGNDVEVWCIGNDHWELWISSPAGSKSLSKCVLTKGNNYFVVNATNHYPRDAGNKPVIKPNLTAGGALSVDFDEIKFLNHTNYVPVANRPENPDANKDVHTTYNFTTGKAFERKTTNHVDGRGKIIIDTYGPWIEKTLGDWKSSVGTGFSVPFEKYIQPFLVFGDTPSCTVNIDSSLQDLSSNSVVLDLSEIKSTSSDDSMITYGIIAVIVAIVSIMIIFVKRRGQRGLRTLHYGEKLHFLQLDINLDGKITNRSNWGAVNLSYIPQPKIGYFNLSINGNWQIQNAPIFPAYPHVKQFALSFYFSLGVEHGTPVKEVQYGYSLTSDVIEQMPPSEHKALLKQLTYIKYSNFSGELFGPLADGPNIYQGSPIVNIFACRTDVPNQPCGKNECGPTAVSNNLKWLNDKYHLGIPKEKLTINYWKDPLGWKDDGVPLSGKWAALKDAYVNKPENGLPIDSTRCVGARIAEVMKQFNDPNTPQAVEVSIGHHIATVICMSIDENGNYHIVASSDQTQNGQNGPGTPVSEPIVISPTGDVISGPDWTMTGKGKHKQGLSVENFVVQCPHPNKFH